MSKVLALSFYLLLLPLFGAAQRYDAELVSSTTSILINRGRLITDYTYEIKINNRNGERYTDVVIPFSPLVKVSKIDAYILDANGNQVKKIRRRDIKERSSISDISLYEDQMVKFFTLRHHAYPYTLVYSYRAQRREFISLTSWLPVLEIDVPTHYAVLEIEMPDAFEVNINQQFTDSYSIEQLGENVKHRWEASYTDLLKPENFSPWFRQYLPSVAVVPLNFRYDINGNQSDWIEFGNWHYSLLDGLSDLPLAEKARITRLVEGVACKKEKIKILYQYLQSTTRYINIAIETGGFKPYPASYVARNRYGDCKALSNYFKAVLNHAGIPSYYTLIWAGNDKIRHVNKEFPSSQFNHVILGVPVEGDTLWLDCTSKGPFNYPGTFNQNREALLIDFNNSHFVHIPALTKEEVKRERFVRFVLQKNHLSTTQFSTVYRAREFESLYMADLMLQSNRKEQYLRNNFSIHGFEVLSFHLNEPDFINNEILLEQVAVSGNYYQAIDDQILIKVMPFDIPRFSSPANRQLPVRMELPIYYSDVLEYQLPKGFSPVLENQHVKINSVAGYYKMKSEREDDKLIVKKEILIKQGTYEAHLYEGLYDFIEQVRKLEGESFLNIQRTH